MCNILSTSLSNSVLNCTYPCYHKQSLHETQKVSDHLNTVFNSSSSYATAHKHLLIPYPPLSVSVSTAQLPSIIQVTYCSSRTCSTPASYVEGPSLKFQAEDKLPWHVFLSHPKLVHAHFFPGVLPHSLAFIWPFKANTVKFTECIIKLTKSYKHIVPSYTHCCQQQVVMI